MDLVCAVGARRRSSSRPSWMRGRRHRHDRRRATRDWIALETGEAAARVLRLDPRHVSETEGPPGAVRELIAIADRRRGGGARCHAEGACRSVTSDRALGLRASTNRHPSRSNWRLVLAPVRSARLHRRARALPHGARPNHSHRFWKLVEARAAPTGRGAARLGSTEHGPRADGLSGLLFSSTSRAGTCRLAVEPVPGAAGGRCSTVEACPRARFPPCGGNV